ncbi:hypothetical protein NLX71_11950 [Paenibacillus sp. MZ04-78.2]|uniref:hypothetical protein n=1 Tax=Paenibacillus sp. MZ04-78.2 TaxID=2962034 RepID=UPI0020B72FF4|nr:hypothetical protein [Paenibacillus sp. MZ04-78.2]MCP3774015.1 hypothetical protein [Paenibacillus sp. MZ04-78.2]
MMNKNYDIPEIYNNYTDLQQEKLIELKQLIMNVANNLGDMTIQESLKWGQLTFSSKLGTPIRIDRFSDSQIGLFVHCQTTLVEEWRELFGDSLDFSKNRAILLSVNSELPIEELTPCIQMALTYHKSKGTKKLVQR